MAFITTQDHDGVRVITLDQSAGQRAFVRALGRTRADRRGCRGRHQHHGGRVHRRKRALLRRRRHQRLRHRTDAGDEDDSRRDRRGREEREDLRCRDRKDGARRRPRARAGVRLSRRACRRESWSARDQARALARCGRNAALAAADRRARRAGDDAQGRNVRWTRQRKRASSTSGRGRSARCCDRPRATGRQTSRLRIASRGWAKAWSTKLRRSSCRKRTRWCRRKSTAASPRTS